MSSTRSRAKMLMTVIVVLSLMNAVVPALFLQPRTTPRVPTPSVQDQQAVSSSSIQGIKGHAVLVGTVDTRVLPATAEKSSFKGLPFYSPNGSGSASGSRSSPQVLATTSSSSIGVSSTFDGINFTQSNCGCTPPDVQVAAGPNYVVEMVNTEGETFTKTGVPVNMFFLGSFFQIPSGHFESDPKILYDASSGRWFATLIDYTFTSSGLIVQFSRVMIAVSSNSDPNTWAIYSVTGTFGLGPFPVDGITDQPIIGVSDDKFVVSVNDFALDNGGGQSFQGAQFWVLNKSELVAFASSVDFASFGPNPSLISVHPAQSLSSTTTEYMVTVGVNTTYNGCVDCNPQLLAVTGLPPGNVTVTSTSLPVLPIRRVPAAVEPGGGINTDDTRVLSAAWFQGKLWFTLHEGCIPSGDTVTRSCVRLVQLDTTRSPAAVLQNFDFGANGQYYYYPALRIDGSGNLVVVYGFSSSIIYPSIAVTGQLTTDPVNSLAASQLLKAGSAADQTGRYGDYFGAGVDPSDTSLVWVAGEYNSAGIGAPNCPFSCWSTFIGSASMTGFSAFPRSASLKIQLSSSTSSTITLTSLNGFSGKVTLTASVSGSGLTATVNPAKVTLSSGGSGSTTVTVATAATTSPGIYVVAVTGTSGSFVRSAVISVLVPDFGLTASPSTIGEAVGGSTSSTITVATPNGFIGAVSLSASVSPSSGASCSLSPTSITLGTSGSSTMTCTSSSTGLYNVTVTGTSSSLVHKIYAVLYVASFSISANPVTLVLSPSAAGTSTISLGSIAGFSGTVSLAVTSSSKNVAASLGLTSLLLKSGGSNSTTLTVTPNYLALGNYTVTVTGKSGTQTNLVTLTIAVRTFSITASPSSVAIAPGGTGTFQVQVQSLAGFAGTVTFSYSSPPGLTCSFNPTSVTLGSSANTTMSCSAPSGNYYVSVEGSSGSTNSYTNVVVAVTDFSLSIVPTNIWVASGSSGSVTAVLSPINGFSSSVSLSASNVPTGTTVTFSPNPVQMAGYYNSYSSVTISPTITTPVGNHTITITGLSGSISHSAYVNIIVLTSPTISVPQATATFTGASVTYSGSFTVDTSGMTLTGSMSYTAINSTTGIFIDAATVSMSLPLTRTAGPTTTSSIEIPTSPLWISVTCIYDALMGTASCQVIRTPDLDHNGTIDSADYNVVVAAFGCSSNQTCYVAAADLRATGTVDSYDVTIEARQVGGSLFLPADFALSASPSTVSFLAGQAATSQISVSVINGFTGSVSLTISTPAGLACTLNPTSVSPGGGSSTLTCNSSASNTYTATLTGVKGVISHSSAITVNALAYVLSSSPSSINVPVSSSGTITITVSASPGFSGKVNLTATVSPSGPTVSVSPASVTLSSGGSATATLTVSTGASATGAYTITVTGTSGSTSISTAIPLAVSDFTVCCVGGYIFVAGHSIFHTIYVNSINGFTGTVSLSFMISPMISCTLSPTSVTLGGSAQSTFMCPNISGTQYTITLTGSSGSITHTQTGTDYVSDFTFTASPTSLTAERLAFTTSTLSINTNANFGCFCTMILSATAPSGFSLIFSDPAYSGNLFGGGLTKFMYSSYSDTLTLVVLVDSSVVPGTYTLTLSTYGGGGTHTVALTVTVANFSISANPASLTFKSNSSGSTTITVTAINGYSGNILLTALFPSALSCSFSNTISLGTTATSTLTCSGSVGSFTVIVTAAGNSLSHSITIPVTVTH